jgi:hypothetical protein
MDPDPESPKTCGSGSGSGSGSPTLFKCIKYYFIIFRCEKEEDLAMIAAQQYYIEFATDMNAER